MMTQLVFLRGANVGGHRTFRPSLLAARLSHLGASSVGAAGTFVVRGAIGRAALRAEIQKQLPFETEVLICPAGELLRLARPDPFGDKPSEKGARRFISVMEKPLAKTPGLPLLQPAGPKWEVQIVAVRGRFVLSLWLRRGRAILYPNPVVEKCFGVRATTRGWDTVLRILELLP
jgi:uncharacterized protein (DUF1697 family)